MEIINSNINLVLDLIDDIYTICAEKYQFDKLSSGNMLEKMMKTSKLKLRNYLIHERNYCSQSPDFKHFHSVVDKCKSKFLDDVMENIEEDIKMVENVALELEGDDTPINFTYQGFRKIENKLLSRAKTAERLQEEVENVKNYAGQKLHPLFFEEALNEIEEYFTESGDRLEVVKQSVLGVPENIIMC